MGELPQPPLYQRREFIGKETPRFQEKIAPPSLIKRGWGSSKKVKLFNRKETREKRKALRRNGTEAESLLWSKLRNRQVNGYKFFRQYGIGLYIVDFYCPQLKVVIEIDGGQHFTPEGQAYDKQREEYMVSAGIKTIRFSNLDIFKNMDGVLMCIGEELPQPLFTKEGSD